MHFSAGSSTKSITGLQGTQPSNSYAFVQTTSSYNTIRYSMYCCSNYTYSSSNYLTRPSGGSLSSNYGSLKFSRYSSGSYAGCIQMRFEQSSSSYYRHRSRTFSLSTSYRGIYTCNIQNSRRSTLRVNFAVYEENYNLSKYNFDNAEQSSYLKVCLISGFITPTCRSHIYL